MDTSSRAFILAGCSNVHGDVDGNGGAARFANPHGIVVDDKDNTYTADRGNNLIRCVSSAGVVTTVAGQRITRDSESELVAKDGAVSVAVLVEPHSLVLDGHRLFVSTRDTIRLIDLINKVVCTVAGLEHDVKCKCDPTAWCSRDYEDGCAFAARFHGPHGLALWNQSIAAHGDSSNINTDSSSNSSSNSNSNSSSSKSQQNKKQRVDKEKQKLELMMDPAKDDQLLLVADSENHSVRRITLHDAVCALRSSIAPLNAFPPGLLPIIVGYCS